MNNNGIYVTVVDWPQEISDTVKNVQKSSHNVNTLTVITEQSEVAICGQEGYSSVEVDLLTISDAAMQP